MADNTLQQENKSIATEDIGGNQVQRIKPMLGDFGVDDGNISVTNPMPVIDHTLAIARQLIPTENHIRIFGSNPDVDTAAAENIWAAGGLFTFPPAAETFNIVSDDPTDNGVVPNTGARTIRVTGLDAAYAQVSHDLTLNGITPIVTPSMTSIERIEVVTAGSNQANAGNISAVGNTSALTVANFGIGRNASSLGHYMVPAGKTAYLESLSFGAGRATGANVLVTMQTRPFITDVVFTPFLEVSIDTSGLVYPFVTKPSFPAQTQIKFLAETSANNTTVGVFAEILLVDD